MNHSYFRFCRYKARIGDLVRNYYFYVLVTSTVITLCLTMVFRVLTKLRIYRVRYKLLLQSNTFGPVISLDLKCRFYVKPRSMIVQDSHLGVITTFIIQTLKLVLADFLTLLESKNESVALEAHFSV